MNKLKLILPMLMLFALTFSLTYGSFGAPTGVTKYFNISIQNPDPTNAIASGTALPIGINAIDFQPYMNGCATNFVFFNGLTDTPINAWLEGNTANEMQTCASNPFNAVGGQFVQGSTNALNGNLLVWVNINVAIAAGTTASNVFSMGFYPMSTNAMSTVYQMGEAPQLTCPPGASPEGCGTYGLYDNGANVFTTLYQDWVGTSTPSEWTLYSPNGELVQNDGLYLKDTASGTYTHYMSTTSNYGATRSQTLDFYGNMAGPGIGNLWSGYALSSTVVGFNANRIGFTNDCGHTTMCDTVSGTIVETANVNYVSSINWYSQTQASFSADYGPQTTSTSIGATIPQEPVAMLSTNYDGQANGNILWARIRTYIPINTIEANGIALTAPSSSVSLSLSNTAIDQGQGILFTATVSTSSGPYSYAFNVYATNTEFGGAANIIANQLFTGIGSPTDTWFWKPSGNLYIGNTLFFANTISINGISSVSNSLSSQFGYNSVLQTPTLLPATATVPMGTPETLTGNVLGGTSSYTYNYLACITGQTWCYGSLYPNNAYNSNSFTFTPMVGGIYNAELIITDSATTNVITNSINSIITVTATSLTPSNTFIDQGQGILFTANAPFGITAPVSYAYKVYVTNSYTSSIVSIANMLFTGNTYTSNSWFWQPTGNFYIGNSLFHANVMVSNALPTSTNAVTYFGYNSIPSVNVATVTPPSPSVSSTTTFTIGATGGTGLFQAELYNITGSKQQGSNRIIVSPGGTNTFVLSTGTVAGPFSYYWILSDMGATTPNVFNSVSIPIIVGMSVAISPLSNTSLIGYPQTITANVLGGTPPYTYNWLVYNTLGFWGNTLYTGNYITSNSFTFTPLVANVNGGGADTYDVNVIVEDSSTPNIITGSVNSVIIEHQAVVSQAISILSACAGQYNSGVGDTAQVKNLSGSTIQQFTIVNPNFLIYTPFANLPYTISILYPNGTVIYTQTFVPSSITITAYLACLHNTVPTTNQPQISLLCQPNTIGIQPYAYCQGNDASNDVFDWTVLIINYSNPLGVGILANSVTFLGNYFAGNILLPSNSYYYYTKVVAHVNYTKDPTSANFIYGFVIHQIGAVPPNPYSCTGATGSYCYNWMFALAFLMIPLVFAYYHRTAYLILTAVIIWFGAGIGLFNFNLADMGALTVLIVIIIIIDERTG